MTAVGIGFVNWIKSLILDKTSNLTPRIVFALAKSFQRIIDIAQLGPTLCVINITGGII